MRKKILMNKGRLVRWVLEGGEDTYKKTTEPTHIPLSLNKEAKLETESYKKKSRSTVIQGRPCELNEEEK